MSEDIKDWYSEVLVEIAEEIEKLQKTEETSNKNQAEFFKNLNNNIEKHTKILERQVKLQKEANDIELLKIAYQYFPIEKGIEGVPKIRRMVESLEVEN